MRPKSWRKSTICTAVLGDCHSGFSHCPCSEFCMHATLVLLQEYSKKYADEVKEEGELDPKARVVAKVGKLDAKKNIDRTVQSLMSKSILQCMGTMLDSVVF